MEALSVGNSMVEWVRSQNPNPFKRKLVDPRMETLQKSSKSVVSSGGDFGTAIYEPGDPLIAEVIRRGECEEKIVIGFGSPGSARHAKLRTVREAGKG